MNPIEWFAWLYGKCFLGHPIRGGVLIALIWAAFGLLLWIRGVDKYNEDHKPPKTDSLSAPHTTTQETTRPQLEDKKKSASQSASPVQQPIQDIHRSQQETIAGIIRTGIPENEPVLVLAATTPEQLDTFARKITGALKLGGMNPELGTSNHLRPGIVIQYSADKKDYADAILDAFVKARVPGPITMQPGSPPRPLTIVISSTD